MEVDITGVSGEQEPKKRRLGNAHGGEPASLARQWRDMAARCRNLAQWLNEADREVLLRMADEYEARARRIDQRQEKA
jgi:hypothetical protein